MVGTYPSSFDALELANYLAVEAEGSNQSSNDQHMVNGGSSESADANSSLRQANLAGGA